MDKKAFMEMAIQKAYAGIKKGQTPFGACIVRGGRVIACEHNNVWRTTDITAHAEVCAIRAACLRLKTIDLSGCELYSSCEPCPMCFSSIHWARLSKVIYGATIGDAKQLGFHELCVSNRKLKSLGKSPVKISGPFLRGEALKVFKAFQKQAEGRLY